jgi:hypothetical protein
MEPATEVEIRCPVGLERLFAKLQLTGEQPKYVDGVFLEISCYDCRRKLRDEGTSVKAVFHYFNFLGELVKTEVSR